MSIKRKYQIFVIDWWFFIGLIGGFIIGLIIDNGDITIKSLFTTIIGAVLVPYVQVFVFAFKINKYSRQTQRNYYSVLNRMVDLCYENKTEEFEKTTGYLSFLGDKVLGNKSFNPNDTAIKSLYNMESLISFTNAHPLEWLHPTFDFYLLNNYILSLHHENKKSPKEPTVCEDRTCNKYTAYKQQQQDILMKLSTKNYAGMNFSNRFYFLSLNDIKQNDALISNLISGHELCGCNLFLVDTDKYKFANIEKDNKDLFLFLSATNFKKNFDYKAYIKETTIDFAISIDTDGTSKEPKNILYKTERGFTTNALNKSNKELFNEFLSNFCNTIINNNDCLFDIEMLMNSDILKKNDKKCHISFK